MEKIIHETKLPYIIGWMLKDYIQRIVADNYGIDKTIPDNIRDHNQIFYTIAKTEDDGVTRVSDLTIEIGNVDGDMMEIEDVYIREYDTWGDFADNLHVGDVTTLC